LKPASFFANVNVTDALVYLLWVSNAWMLVHQKILKIMHTETPSTFRLRARKLALGNLCCAP
jgi:hypothetical protein